MTSLRTIFCFLFVALLVACASENLAPAPTDTLENVRSSSEMTNLSEHGQVFVIDIPEIPLKFPYWKNLTPIKNVDYMGNPDRAGEYGFDLEGSGVNALLSVVRYDLPSDGVHDWTIPHVIRDEFSERTIDERRNSRMPSGTLS